MSEAPAAVRGAPVHAETTLQYIHPDCEGGILYELQRESSTLVFDPHATPIRDARKADPTPRLETHGFELVVQPLSLDPAELMVPGFNETGKAYGDQMAALVRRMTGASEVLVFGQVVRDEAQPAANKPAHSVHVDFDRKTLAGFLLGMRPDDGEALLNKRFSNINLWRGLAPVERTPLAVCEGTSIAPGDLRTGLIRLTPEEPGPSMSGFNIAWSPDHRWWCYPHMTPDEVLLFRIYNSDPDRVQRVAHTAFDDPTAAANAPPRRSLEIRTLAFFE